jgi:two-component system, NarL family, nitrate/nitrite response regulator NarL
VLGKLTKRERHIVRLMVAGRSNREIAEWTGLTIGTVKIHLHNIFTKLRLKSRFKLMARWRRRRA